MILSFILTIITGFSRQETMKNNDTIITLIKKLNDTDSFSVLKLETILESNFFRVNDSDNALDWLVPDQPSNIEKYELKKSKVYKELKSTIYEIRSIENNKKEHFLSVHLNNNAFIDFKTIQNTFGDNNKLITQAANVPDDKRCNAVYEFKDKLITFGFPSCNNMKEISHFHILSK